MKHKLTIFIMLIFATNMLMAQVVVVDIKVLLEGPYTSGGMTTSLDLTHQLSHPYGSVHSGSESVVAGFFATHTNIVDWILLELRDKDDNTLVIKKRAAFLLDDGHIVDLDGISPVGFNVTNADYYVSVYHRNHLSILSADIVYRSTCPGTPKVYYGGGPNNDNDGNGDYYTTVQIATQCWFRENLNVGTRIDGNSDQTNNAGGNIIEKYCYDNNEANCVTYGGLYQWDEVMQYVTTEGVQGICASGWHIPTYADLQTLKAAVSNSSNALKAVGQGTGNGVGNNSSGFSALLAGSRNFNNGSFGYMSGHTFFWSSTESGSNAYNMYLIYGNDDVGLHYHNKNYGFSVRCIKD